MKILVIENDEFLAENLCQYLKQIDDLQVNYVTRAREAYDLLSQNSYDIVVSDIWLPDCQSNDWLLEIGEISPGQKMIVISSYPLPQKVSRSDQLNIIGYFEKPFDVKIIGNLLAELNHKILTN